jgi:hypothetical protein
MEVAMLLWVLSATLFAQAPAPVTFKAGTQDLSYLQSGDQDVPAVLFVLPAQPDKPQTEWERWNQVAATKKWGLVMPLSTAPGDAGLRLLGQIVTEARKRHSWSKPAMYLVGSGPLSPTVFYIASRAPHLFSAAVAIGGSPKPAMDTDRLFAGNTELVPVAWAVTPEEKAAESAAYQRLITSRYNLKVLESPTIQQTIDFLAGHPYQPYPPKIDCETGNPVMSRCYWITPTQFDPSLRNDALPSTKIAPDSSASLDFGGFGFQPNNPGPGVLVEWLPPDYKGPLQLKDRITHLSGKAVADPKHYAELMSQVTEEKPVAVTIERGTGKAKERIRLVTRYQLRKREEVITARVQAFYNASAKEVAIASRTVAELRLTVPPQWVPVTVNWNGVPVATVENPGCYLLSLKEPGSSRSCPAE